MAKTSNFRDRLRARAIEIGARRNTWPTLALMRFLTRIRLWPAELQAIAQVVKDSAPCNFLVFGLGNDTPFWTALNPGGKTVFLEDIEGWYEKVTARDPSLQAYLVEYNTVRTQWQQMLGTPAVFDLALPGEVRDTKWDVILVDAPMGWTDSKPGRMKSIAIASRLVRDGGHVFVHDCDREVERTYASAYLKEENLVRAMERLRHYRSVASS